MGKSVLPTSTKGRDNILKVPLHIATNLEMNL